MEDAKRNNTDQMGSLEQILIAMKTEIIWGNTQLPR